MRQTIQKPPSSSSASPALWPTETGVAIVGGGISGLTLATLLACGGIPTVCIDRDNPTRQADAAFDGRTMAISDGSRQVLAAAGLWEDLEDRACPIRQIDIYDCGEPRRLAFHSAEMDDRTFGWIIDIRDLRAGLFALAARTPGLVHLAPAQVLEIDRANPDTAHIRLEIPQEATPPQTAQKAQHSLKARLVIGADGRGSFSRRQAGIGIRGWSYGQTAIVCTVAHQNPHDFIAVEDFRPEGPFAILPMTDAADGTHRSSIVWTCHGKGRSAMDYDDATFDVALAARFPAHYGVVRRIGPRFSYPLTLQHAKTYIDVRLALVADAAHGIHPIAGQGLNIGLRDVAALADLLIRAHREGQDLGAREVLRLYERSRRADNMAMAGATDLLTVLFSNDIGPVRTARRLGLEVVRRLPVVKRFFMSQAMGNPDSFPGNRGFGQRLPERTKENQRHPFTKC